MGLDSAIKEAMLNDDTHEHLVLNDLRHNLVTLEKVVQLIKNMNLAPDEFVKFEKQIGVAYHSLWDIYYEMAHLSSQKIS